MYLPICFTLVYATGNEYHLFIFFSSLQKIYIVFTNVSPAYTIVLKLKSY